MVLGRRSANPLKATTKIKKRKRDRPKKALSGTKRDARKFETNNSVTGEGDEKVFLSSSKEFRLREATKSS